MRTRKNYLPIVIFWFGLLGFGPQAWATQEHYSGSSVGTSIQGDVILVKDGKIGHPLWDSIQQTLSVKNMILFEMDQDDPNIVPVSGTYQVDLTIELWYAANVGNTSPDTTLTDTLSFDYDTTSINPTAYRSILPLADAHQMRITINVVHLPTGITGTPPSLRVYGEIIVDRIYNFDCNQQVSFGTFPSTSVEKAVTIGWNPVEVADEYDLEWTFYDSLSQVGFDIRNNGGIDTTNYNWLFKQNATRITTDQNEYKINLIYPDGHLFFRIRAVHYDTAEVREFTKWSSILSSDVKIKDFPDRINVLWHDSTYNWQSQIVFAEQGKNVPSVNYFDGSLRQRQSVTLSNSDTTGIVQQTIYDHHGRPAVNVLPAPNDNPFIAYDSLFALNSNDDVYTKTDFDLGNFSVVPDFMSTTSGASKYFSSNNDNSNQGFNQFLPDAEKYPFTVTEFTPDQSGRIRRQSGVGASFQIGSDHETRYFYGKPTQKELDRLFGNEVGDDSHYFKNAVVDPNGQVSVSYIDAHGRTIATALAGPPDAVSLLSIDTDSVSQVRGNIADTTDITIDLLNNIRSTYEVSSTHTLIVTTDSLKHDFSYELDESFYQPICVDTAICYDCIYDLVISITDDKGNTLINDTLRNYNPASTLNFDTLCSLSPLGLDTTFIDTLSIGEYKVTKLLTINQEAMNYYADHFLSQAACLPDLEELVADLTAKIDFSGCEVSCDNCLEDLGSQDTFINRVKLTILAADGGLFTVEDSLELVEQYFLLVEACEDLCKQYDECEGLLQAMRNDVSPGGQYAGIVFVPVPGDTLNNDTLNVITTDPTSIFYFQNGSYAYQDANIIYIGADGILDSVSIDGEGKSPNELTPIEWITNWNPVWVDTLVKYFHPEYCYYEWCLLNKSSNEFDQSLYNIESLSEAIDSGLIDSTGLIDINADPFFQSGGLGDTCVAKMDSLFNHINPYEEDAPSLIDFITEQIYGITCETLFGQGSTAENDQAWLLLRNMYLGFKDQIKRDKRNALSNCHPDVDCIDNPDASCNSSDYQNKIRRLENTTLTAESYELSELEQQRDDNMQEMATLCAENCETNVNYWMAQLESCSEQEFSSADRTAAMVRLRAVCELGCDFDRPNGASTTPLGANGQRLTTSYSDTSFVQVLASYLGGEEACSDCSAYLIDFPAPYDNGYQGPQTVRSKDPCLCENLIELESCYTTDSLGYATFSEYLLQFSETSLSAAELDTLKLYCTTKSDSRYLPQPMVIPPYLECGICKTCDEVTPLVTAFDLTCTDTINYDDRLARYLNQQLGWSLLPEAYADFLARCDNNPLPGSCSSSLQLCPSTPYDKVEPDNSCATSLINQAKAQALIAYGQILDSLREAFVGEYLAACLDNLTESFEVDTKLTEYQYTLYYYDQAGNLVKTIPPQGVVLDNGPTFLDDVEAYRKGLSANIQLPDHKMPTVYVYNSLNQVVLEDTPDAEKKEFWYDDLGRLVASRDGRQDSLDYYSYTVYDVLGRITEVGEITSPTAPMTDVLAKNQVQFKDWVDNNIRQYVTGTYYDELPSAFDLNNTGIDIDILELENQQHLRNRVALSTFSELSYIFSGNLITSATAYEYDVVGNVKTLLQQDLSIGLFYDRNYKQVDYEYDFLSGNVNAVYYQRGQWDQFTHRYSYDDNNRLIEVYTSLVNTKEPLASPLWDREASYQYYKHGPLARSVMGQYQVQGSDYAYTIQGWIKGVNSGILDTDWDMGNDGTTTSPVARDACGYTIGYFNGDYNPIGGVNAAIELPYVGSDFADQSKPLYNGNIQHIVSHNRKLGELRGYAYQYDQLHRIKQSRSRSLTSPTTYSWVSNTSGSTEYRTDYSYDLNGNLQTLDRGGAGGAGMDVLTYSYYGNHESNLLGQVSDLLSSGGGVANGQPINNYQYDGSGNLIRNEQEEVDITWTPYGKPATTKNLDLDGNGDGTSIHSVYYYDASQNRVGFRKTYSQVVNNQPSQIDSLLWTYYVRDAQGNVLSVYQIFTDTADVEVRWTEAYLYGSSRLGVLQPKVTIPGLDSFPNSPIFVSDSLALWLGRKRFELTNHLGNVTATLSDRRQPIDVGSTGSADYYDPVVLSAADYFPFGLEMPGRTYQSGDYRFGFNGKEKDNQKEWGEQTHYDYGFRIYNPGIGRFLSVDPLTRSYPWYTPYQFAGNSPIMNIDVDGLEPAPSITGNEYEGQSETTHVSVPDNYKGWAPPSKDWYYHSGGLDGYEAGWYNETSYKVIVKEIGRIAGKELAFYEKNGSNSNAVFQDALDPNCNCSTLTGVYRNPLTLLLGRGYDTPEWEAQFGDVLAQGANAGYSAFWNQGSGRLDPSYPIFEALTFLEGGFLIKRSFKKGAQLRLSKLRNGHLAGKVHPKTGVPFNKSGFPDFSGHLYKGGKNNVYIKGTGDRLKDEAAANAAAGYKSTPKGYTWHHHQQRGRMQLIDKNIHRKTGHTGGFSIWSH